MTQQDLIVWGATGFTGRLVAQYLDAQAPSGFRWSIGGRSRAKLEALAAELNGSPGIFIGDSLDPASMANLAGQTRVVVSTVGPFARHGGPLVQACVEAGTDYCDITGETHWVRENIDRHHTQAVETGARIVHCCGFDSVPSDLGVWMLHDRLQEDRGEALASARFYLMKSKGGFSGGTIASMLDILEAASKDRSLRRMLADPFSLDPSRSGSPEGRNHRDRFEAEFDETIQRWTAPFLMAAINTRIVRRSNALLGYPYGRDFRYSEVMVARSRGQARMIRYGLGAAVGLGSSGAGRWLLRKFLPAPGEGPTEKEREEGFFSIRLVGRSASTPATEIQLSVKGQKDPGYGETSKMLAESGLCLASDEIPRQGGITTPAAALGSKLLLRLQNAGMTFGLEPPRI